MPLDLNYHHLYYFWVSVRCGSLTAASRELNLSQSALSLQLKSLEKSLGRRLLNRSRSGVLPTTDGLLVFERCERIFPEGEALSGLLRSGKKQTAVPFRFGCASGLGREVALAALQRLESIPQLLPMLYFGPGGDVLQRLLRHQLDAALFSGDNSAALGPAFRCRRLDAVPLRFVASPRFAAKLGPFPRRGREYPMLMRPPDHPVRVKTQEWMRERGLGSLAVAETADVDLLCALALQGRGIAVLHVGAVRDDLAAGRLVALDGAPRDLLHEIWAATPVREPLDAEAREAAARIMRLSPVFAKAARPRGGKR